MSYPQNDEDGCNESVFVNFRITLLKFAQSKGKTLKFYNSMTD